MEFIAELVRALAWPVALLVVVLILRRPVVDLLRREGLKRLKAGPVEAEWERQLGRLEGEIARLPPRDVPMSLGHRPQPVFTDSLVQLAAREPVAAIDKAYAGIGAALGAVLEVAGVTTPDKDGPLELARVAYDRGLVSDKTIHAIEGTAVMRNLAVSRPATTDERRALEYLPLADAVVYAVAHDASVALEAAARPADES